jgi:methyltransferase (TIGR00027 family)
MGVFIPEAIRTSAPRAARPRSFAHALALSRLTSATMLQIPSSHPINSPSVQASRPSRTAAFVAFGRALADAGLSHVENFHDPVARIFLSEKAKQKLSQLERAARGPKPNGRVAAVRVMADTMALRTSAIDESLRNAIANGARQLVILGAGYDGRAWRMPELAGITVFEADHPATQGDKRSHAAELPPPMADVRFVPIDFERESLGAVLGRAGHDPSSPTCWIWEGVVMYLTRDAMRATLAAIAGRSAKGSTLIVNYHIGGGLFLARLLIRFIGEPQISFWTPEEMAADLRAAGFAVREDSGSVDWNQRFARGGARSDRTAYMRIATGRR